MQAGVTQAGVTQAGVTQAGVTQAGVTQCVSGYRTLPNRSLFRAISKSI